MQYTIRRIPKGVDNAIRDLCKGVAETVEILEEADAIVPLFVVLAELRAGFLFGRRQAENDRALHPIPTNDMWLAALVLQHNVALHAKHRHFDHLPRIVRV